MSEWKPCPFCGSHDLVMSGREEYAFMTGKRLEFYRVKCDTCGAMVDNDFKDADEAIEAWNKRVNIVVRQWITRRYSYECPECEETSYGKSPYCPHCGTKMEVE